MRLDGSVEHQNTTPVARKVLDQPRWSAAKDIAAEIASRHTRGNLRQSNCSINTLLDTVGKADERKSSS
jgi:hypothetical protein